MNTVQDARSGSGSSNIGAMLQGGQTSQAKRSTAQEAKPSRSRSVQQNERTDSHDRATEKTDSASETGFARAMRTHSRSDDGASETGRGGRRARGESGRQTIDSVSREGGAAVSDSATGDTGYDDILMEETGYDEGSSRGQGSGKTSSDGYLSELGSYLLGVAQLRQDMLEERMQKGLDSGRITADEQRELETKIAANDDLIAEAAEDGFVTGRELAGIVRAQNATRRALFRYRNNDDTTLTAQGTGLAGTSARAGTLNVTT
ncbi:hypothetical protein JCM15519_30240 [Fundidesulfovibrio butyratiphilus]